MRGLQICFPPRKRHLRREGPLLPILHEGDVGERIVAAVHGGFFSVTADTVRVLAESADLAGEVDVDAARKVLSDASATEVELRAAQGQVRAVEATVTD